MIWWLWFGWFMVYGITSAKQTWLCSLLVAGAVFICPCLARGDEEWYLAVFYWPKLSLPATQTSWLSGRCWYRSTSTWCRSWRPRRSQPTSSGTSWRTRTRRSRGWSQRCVPDPPGNHWSVAFCCVHCGGIQYFCSILWKWQNPVRLICNSPSVTPWINNFRRNIGAC